MHQPGDDRRRRGRARDPKAAHRPGIPRIASSHLGEQVDRVGGYAEQELGAGLFEPIDQARTARQIVQDQFAAAGERCNQRTESEIVTERTQGVEHGALQPPIARHRSGCGEQRVVAVHNALRLPGRAGGEGQIHHLIGIPAPLGFECWPWHFAEWHSVGRADAPGAT